MVIDVEKVIWLDFIVEKINQKHGVNESEVIELLESKTKKVRWVEKGNVKGEKTLWQKVKVQFQMHHLTNKLEIFGINIVLRIMILRRNLRK